MIEAKFAVACDRLEPLMQNYLTKGFAWKKNGIKKDQVLEKNKHITDASQALWQYANSIINESVEKGYLAEI